jgi:Fe-S cluster assembly protein SufD
MKIIKVNNNQKIKLTKPGEYLIQLIKPHSQAEITGIFRATGLAKIKVSVVIWHQAAHTKAITLLKGVADDQGQLKFAGKIIIDNNGSQSNSFLTERVLLLSDQATAEVIPDLEIKADDVKCSHAASISNISKNQLFYLMSRGLNKEQAKRLIVKGFLAC